MSTLVHEKDLGRGLDQYRPETKLDQGFVTNVRNWDPKSNGSLVRRQGWERVGGSMPLRVKSITRISSVAGTWDISFFDVTLAESLPVGPIIIAGSAIQVTSGFASFFRGTTLSNQLGSVYFSTFERVDETTIRVTVTPGNGEAATTALETDTNYVYDRAGLDAYVWGIPNAYATEDSDTDRSTWVTGLLPYTRAATNTDSAADTLIATFRGNLHSLEERDVDSGNPFKMPSTTANIAVTSNATRWVGRAFYGSTPVNPPLRGYIEVPDNTDGFLVVSGAEYDSGTGYTTYTLSAPGHVASASLSTILRGNVDYLTVQDMGWDVLEGEFLVVSAATPDADTITVTVLNEANQAEDAQRSETGAGGKAGVFTDRIAYNSAQSPLTRGDVIDSLAGESDLDLSVLSCDGGTLVVGPFDEPLQVMNAEVIGASRTSSVLPLTSATNFVRDDQCSIGDYPRTFRVTNVVLHADEFVSVTADGLLMTVTTSNAAQYFEGDQFYVNAPNVDWSGAYTVTAVDGSAIYAETTDVFDTTTATLQGSVIGLDEAIELTDDDAVEVPSRWRVTRGQTANLRTQTSAFVNRKTLGVAGIVDAPFPSLVTVGDCVYASNGTDLVHKWDGETTYPAGLFPFAPSVGVSVITDYFATIVNRATSVAGAATGFTFDPTNVGETEAFNTQSSLVLQGPISSTDPRVSRQARRISNIDLTPIGSSAATGNVKFTTPVDAITANVTAYIPQTFRYYYRYAYTDARGNVTYSAASQSQDVFVTMGQSAAVAHKLLNYPSILLLPFERLTLEIYRTGINDRGQADGSPPFYRIASLPLNGNQSRGVPTTSTTPMQYAYGQLSFVDTLQPEDQSSEALDPVTSLYPPESLSVGTYIYPPPRAKAMAVIDNSLVCANIKSPPRVELAFRPPVSSGGPVRASSLAASSTQPGVSLVFRRNGATGSSTDETDVKAFQWVTYNADDTAIAGNSFPGCEVAVFNNGMGLSFINNSLVSTLRTDTSSASVVGMWIATLGKKFATQNGSATLEASGWHRIQREETGLTYTNGVVVFSPVERSIPITIATAATNLLTSTVPHLLSIGTPIMLGYVDKQYGLQGTVQYYARPVTDTTFALHYSVADAIAGTNTVDIASNSGGIEVYTVDAAATGPQANIVFTIGGATTTLPVTGGTASLRLGDVVNPTATGGGLTAGTYYFVRVIDANNIALHTSLSDALTATASVNVTVAATYNLARVSQRRLYTVCYSASKAIPVPVLKDDTVSSTTAQPTASVQPITMGANGDERYAPEATFLRAIRELGRAINMTTTNGSSDPAAGFAAFTGPAYNQAFLTARWGGDTPYASLLVESPDGVDFTVEVKNTTLPQTSASALGTVASERLLVFANGVRLQNAGLGSEYVSSSANQFSMTNHGLRVADRVRFATTGTLPTNVTAGTAYYAIPLDRNTFALATTADLARAGTKMSLGSAGTGFHYYTVETDAKTLKFPSRLSVSFPNFPEMHDRPYDDNALIGNSQSIIDVNPDDGEEIENVINAFGDSFSNAAQQEGRLFVAKTKSVYMVDVRTKEWTKIPTLGHGAYYPRSVAETKDGVQFADQDGIYKVNRSNQWVYLGLPLGRAFTSVLDGRDADRDIPVAAHDVGDHRVLTAWPLVEDEGAQTGVIVYDHTREGMVEAGVGEGGSRGAWTLYDNMPTTCWAEWNGLTYRGTRDGTVLRERQYGDASDYRDDASAYTSTVDLRPMDFDAMGDRKRVNRVSIQFRRDAGTTVDGIRVYCMIDNSGYFEEMDRVELEYTPADTNLSDREQKVIWTISYSVPKRKAEFFQLRIVDANKDEPVEITQVTYLVDMLDQKGTTQAKETTR